MRQRLARERLHAAVAQSVRKERPDRGDGATLDVPQATTKAASRRGILELVLLVVEELVVLIAVVIVVVVVAVDRRQVAFFGLKPTDGLGDGPMKVAINLRFTEMDADCKA